MYEKKSLVEKTWEAYKREKETVGTRDTKIYCGQNPDTKPGRLYGQL